MITIAEARQIVAKDLDLPSFDVPADLKPEDRERLYDGLANYIIEHFEDFDARSQQWAGQRIDSPFFLQPLEEFGAGDAVSSFFGEFAEQGRKIVTFENKFVRTVAISAAVGFGLWFAFKASLAANQIKSVVK